MKITMEPTKRLDGARIYLEKPEPTFENARQMFAVVEANRTHILPLVRVGL